MTAKRIVMVNKYYPPHVGGIEFHMRDLAEGLVAAGNQVRVIVSSDERYYHEDVINGVEVVRLPRLFERASTPVVRKMGQVLSFESQQADILHFHFPYPWAEFEWVGQMASKRVPYVVTYHADIVRQKGALAAYGPFLNKFLNRAQLIMTSSPQLIKYSSWLSPRAAKCRQVNFGLPVEQIAHNSAAIQRADQLRAEITADAAVSQMAIAADNDASSVSDDFASSASKPIVLFVGRLVYYKGVEVLAHAIPQVDAHFVIIGKGPEKHLLEKFDPQTAARVHFIDYADNDELIAWLHAADILTLPSVEVSEAFGLVQIEAHAAGTPTVSSRLRSGVPYANLDGVTGLTFPPRDSDALAGALNALIADDELRTRLGKQAQERALSDFTIQKMIDGVQCVYHEAIDLHRQQSAIRCMATKSVMDNSQTVDRENVDGV